MAEAEIFSPSDSGGILWMISAVGESAIGTGPFFRWQVAQQWAAMGFDMAVPAIEMVQDRSGRRRMVKDERGGKRYGVKG